MGKFYSYHPTTTFERKVLTDLNIRVKIRDTWLNDPKIYYNYQYQEQDKPEHIALKYYGDEELHWIILLTNNIFDVNFDFPMNSDIFPKYLENKYKVQGDLVGKTGYQYALSTPDPEYQYQEHVRIIASDGIQDKYYVVDEEYYYSLFEHSNPSSRKQIQTSDGEFVIYQVSRRFPLVTIFDRENDINESKRLMKLLKKDYVQQAKTEILRLLK
jgi:hypothetical protein